MLGRKDECGARRTALVEAEAAFAAREEFNLLYVALTRAQEFFFASGIASGHSSMKTSFWDRIDAALAALGSGEGVHGDAPSTVKAASKAMHPAAPLPQSFACSPAGIRREAASPGKTYGVRLHAALDWLSSAGDAGRPPQGIPAADWPALRTAARAILDAPQLRAFFDPTCFLRAFNEAEFALPGGSAGRIDRLVEMPEAYWVLDYKSGRAEAAFLERYRHQLENYRSAVAMLFPDKPVRCGLVFGEGELLEI